MKIKSILSLAISLALCSTHCCAISQAAISYVNSMPLRKKIAQKLMLDFRYWCASKPQNNQPCTQDFTVINTTIKKIVTKNDIGGIILFSNNLQNIAQITTLTDAFQQAMKAKSEVALLIGTDQEGGIVARLPRNFSASFPGNMALAAAVLGDNKANYVAQIGKAIATDLKVLNINTNFAPVTDVNTNPFNSVINVRAFSDDPELVAQLGLQLSTAIQNENVAASLKHFPGHGDTVIDSHIGLPTVNHSLEEAWNIDLYPFKEIIAQNPPDMLMTAHIQYPALDATQVFASKANENIITPATLSRKILTDILRGDLHYKGVIVTDALNMGAISQNFDATDATIKAFQAGADLALMPISITCPEDANKVEELIARIEAEVKNGNLSEAEITASAYRILDLKVKLGLFPYSRPFLPEQIKNAEDRFADQTQRQLEVAVTNAAITLVQNNKQLLPLKKIPANTRIHILTPWLEQGAGIAMEIQHLQNQHQLPSDLQVTHTRMSDTNIEAEKVAIDTADIVIVGNSTTKTLTTNSNFLIQKNENFAFPLVLQGDGSSEKALSTLEQQDEAQFAYQVLQYAHSTGKHSIFISLLAPYDLPTFAEVADAMLVGYDFYGYITDDQEAYYRGPSMQALVQIIFGFSAAKAKLPVNVPYPNNPKEFAYKRGFGLTTRP